VVAVLGMTHRLLLPRRPWQRTRAIERILVIRLDLLGDLLFTLPLVEGLRSTYPRARITMLTLPYTATLAALCPAVDEVIAVDTNRIRTVGGLLAPGTWREYAAVYRRLRSERYDLGISVYGQMGSLWAFLSGAGRAVGYARETYPFLLTDAVPGGRHLERKHEIEYVRRLAAHVGVVDPPRRARLVIPRQATERVADSLSRQGIGADERVVVIHAGAVNGAAKRWPARSWARFAEEVQVRTRAAVVLTGSRADEGIAAEVVRCSQARIVSLIGKTDVVELAALIDRADVVASGDSGPLHLAVALGRPLVAVYGPTDPMVYGPYEAAAPVRLHRKDLPCSPCYTLAATAECPLGDPICMRLVTVREMVESAVELLADAAVMNRDERHRE
jgi:lipopolysaccharide heptosyltransferase II